jgi:hypothetical protein
MTRRELVESAGRRYITEHTLARLEDPNGVSANKEQIAVIARACRLPIGFFTADLHLLEETKAGRRSTDELVNVARMPRTGPVERPQARAR